MAVLPVLPERVRTSLGFAQVLAAATLLRSIAYERWITVAAASLLIAGTLAAQRGRTWGVALSFVVAVWFPVAAMIGIAPAWFIGVGLAAATPFLQLWRSFTKFDRGASILFASLATSLGVAAAVAWKSVASTLFTAFPWLAPSRFFENGLVVSATLAVMVAFAIHRIRQRPAPPPRATIDLRASTGGLRFVARPARVASSDAAAAADAAFEHALDAEDARSGTLRTPR